MGKVLMKGNEAIGEAAIRAGCLNYFAYPITPQSEVAEYLARRLPEAAPQRAGRGRGAGPPRRTSARTRARSSRHSNGFTR